MNTPASAATRKRDAVTTVSLVFLCNCVNTLSVGGVALFLPLIREDLHITFAQAGMLSVAATAKRPQPVLALGASLCAVGALMGRKYRTESNTRSNLYVVGIAESGAGKNHSRVVINELFRKANLLQYLGGNKIASGSGLLTAIQRQLPVSRRITASVEAHCGANTNQASSDSAVARLHFEASTRPICSAASLPPSIA